MPVPRCSAAVRVRREGKVEETTGEIEQAAPQGLLVDLRGERVHNRAGERRVEHRHPHLRGVARVVAQQETSEAFGLHPQILVGDEKPGQRGVALHPAHDAAVLHDQRDHPVEHHLHGNGTRRRPLRCVEGQTEHFEWLGGNGEDDLVLGPELVVDGGLGDTDRVGDHLQRRAARTVSGEQDERRIDDTRLRRPQARVDRMT